MQTIAVNYCIWVTYLIFSNRILSLTMAVDCRNWRCLYAIKTQMGMKRGCVRDIIPKRVDKGMVLKLTQKYSFAEYYCNKI